MSTAVLKNPADIIRQGAPHVIHTDQNSQSTLRLS